jgi:hypothetical protein
VGKNATEIIEEWKVKEGVFCLADYAILYCLYLRPIDCDWLVYFIYIRISLRKLSICLSVFLISREILVYQP